jgi:hypothetical protein
VPAVKLRDAVDVDKRDASNLVRRLRLPERADAEDSEADKRFAPLNVKPLVDAEFRDADNL